jgi:hypothetical protein
MLLIPANLSIFGEPVLRLQRLERGGHDYERRSKVSV